MRLVYSPSILDYDGDIPANQRPWSLLWLANEGRRADCVYLVEEEEEEEEEVW